METRTPVIQLANVVKRYSNDVVIGPVSLDLPQGGIIALVGPDGAGKSTMLTIMGRLMAPDEGSVIGGLDVHQAPSGQVAQTISILRQENHFVTRLTVQQLVGFGRYPYSAGRLTRGRGQDFRDHRLPQYDRSRAAFPGSAFGGQRQRLRGNGLGARHGLSCSVSPSITSTPNIPYR